MGTILFEIIVIVLFIIIVKKQNKNSTNNANNGNINEDKIENNTTQEFSENKDNNKNKSI